MLRTHNKLRANFPGLLLGSIEADLVECSYANCILRTMKFCNPEFGPADVRLFLWFHANSSERNASGSVKYTGKYFRKCVRLYSLQLPAATRNRFNTEHIHADKKVEAMSAQVPRLWFYAYILGIYLDFHYITRKYST